MKGMTLARYALVALGSLAVACAANPTPHPSTEDDGEHPASEPGASAGGGSADAATDGAQVALDLRHGQRLPPYGNAGTVVDHLAMGLGGAGLEGPGPVHDVQALLEPIAQSRAGLDPLLDG